MNASLYFGDRACIQQPTAPIPACTLGDACTTDYPCAYHALPLARNPAWDMGRTWGRWNLPRSWEHARLAYANGRGSHKLCHNTYLIRYGGGPGASESYAIRYHATDVVAFHPDGTATLCDGGWGTPTTRARFKACGFQVFQHRKVQYLGLFDTKFPNRIEFGGRSGLRVRLT